MKSETQYGQELVKELNHAKQLLRKIRRNFWQGETVSRGFVNVEKTEPLDCFYKGPFQKNSFTSMNAAMHLNDAKAEELRKCFTPAVVIVQVWDGRFNSMDRPFKQRCQTQFKDKNRDQSQSDKITGELVSMCKLNSSGSDVVSGHMCTKILWVNYLEGYSQKEGEVTRKQNIVRRFLMIKRFIMKCRISYVHTCVL